MAHILYTVLIIAGLIALRLCLANPAWFFLPKSWQRWLFQSERQPTYPGKSA